MVSAHFSTFQPFNLLTPCVDFKWHALYTKSRHEKFISAELQKKGIEAYLPLRRVQRRWSDRNVITEEPVFSSYIFVRSNPLISTEILKTKGAVKFVSAGHEPVVVSPAVIGSLRTIFTQNIQADPFPYLREGERVCVRSGVFKGVEGFIVRKDDKRCRVVISIDAIMSSISFEVDSCLVEKV